MKQKLNDLEHEIAQGEITVYQVFTKMKCWITQSHSKIEELDGFKAADLIIEDCLNEAGDKKPKRLKDGYQKRAEYREGYYQGLLMAHCFMVWGSHPNEQENQKEIRKILANPLNSPKPSMNEENDN